LPMQIPPAEQNLKRVLIVKDGESQAEVASLRVGSSAKPILFTMEL
jgi:hypothetical protein